MAGARYAPGQRQVHPKRSLSSQQTNTPNVLLWSPHVPHGHMHLYIHVHAPHTHTHHMQGNNKISTNKNINSIYSRCKVTKKKTNALIQSILEIKTQSHTLELKKTGKTKVLHSLEGKGISCPLGIQVGIKFCKEVFNINIKHLETKYIQRCSWHHFYDA